MNKASSGRKTAPQARAVLSVAAGAALMCTAIDLVDNQSALAFDSSLNVTQKSEVQSAKTNLNQKEKGLATEKLVSNKLKDGQWANEAFTPVQTTKARINLTKEISPRLLDDLVIGDLNLDGTAQKVPITHCSRTLELYMVCEKTLQR
jgi:hypothetical protein